MANLDDIQIKLSMDSNDAAKSIDSLIDSLEKLSHSTDAGKSASNINSLSNSLKNLKDIAKNFDIESMAGKIKGFSSSAFGTLKSIAGWGVSLGVIGKQLADSTRLASKYTQTVNMLNTVMGEGAEEAKEFAEELGNVLGLNPADVMNFQATFQNLFVGFGNNAKQAQIMSKNLTQLSYDMAAFYEQLGGDPQAAAEKLRLAMAGTIEPIQRLGYAIKEADLQAVAARQGLNVNIRNLNTASKSMLRYIAVMEQSNHVQGYMAKSFSSPTTAMMVFQSAVKQLSTEIGKTFLPMLMAAIPYIQAFITGVLNMVKTLNNILGIELPTINWDETKQGISGVADEAVSAGKAMQKAFTLGIDELNVLDSSTASAGAGMQDITGLLTLPEYDMLEGFSGEKAKQIEEMLKPLEPLFEGLAQAFAGFYDSVSWLAGDVFYPWLVNVGNWMKENPDTMNAIGKGLGYIAAGILALKGAGAILNPIMNFLTASSTPYVVGITLAVTGTILEITGLQKALEEGFNKTNLIETIGGEALIIGAATLLGKKFGAPFIGAALGAVVAGIPAFVVGLKDAAKNGFSGFNLIDILFSGGATTAGLVGLGSKFAPEIAVALAGVFGDDVGLAVGTALAGGTLTAAISGIVLGLPTFVLGVIDAVKGIDIFNSIAVALGATATGAGIGAIIGAVGGPIGAGIGALIGLIVGALTDLGIWIYQNWDTVKAKTAEIWEGIKSFFTTTIPNIVNIISNFFSELPGKIGYLLGLVVGKMLAWRKNMVDWAKENVPKIIGSIIDFFKELPGKIKEKIDSIRETIAIWAIDMITWIQEELPNVINNIIGWFANLPEALVNIGKNMIYGLWNGILSVGSWLKDKMKDYFGELWDVVSELVGGFGEGVSAGYASVPQYANGGYPTSGEMFFAREDGLPEMVGRVGRQTAVMNNGQIADTMANSLIRAMNQGGASQQPTVIENKLYLDGEVVYNNQQKIQRSKGYNLGMGVFANV